MATAPLPANGETVSGGLRVNVRYDDRGLEREPTYAPTKTATFDYAAVLAFAHAVTQRTGFEAVADTRKEGLLEAAVIRNEAFEMLVLRAGLDYVNAGGWDQKDRGVAVLATSPYNERHMPWSKAKGTAPASGPATAASLSATLKVRDFGAATLQILDDVVLGEDAAARFSKNRRQPAALVEWLGSGATLAPLIQYGAYDLNHSAFGTVGVRLTLAALTVRADLIVDMRAEPNSSRKRVKTQYRSASLDATYDLGAARIFGKFSALDVVQPGNDGGLDHVANQPGLVFDDNGHSYDLGVTYRVDGEAFAPFVAFVGTSGRFLEDAADPRGPAKTKSGRQLDFGITSRF